MECGKCRKLKDIEDFPIRKDGNGRTKTCLPCAEKLKIYRSSDEGKAAVWRANHSASGKASQKKYNQTDKAKASMAKYQKTVKGKASAKRYWRSDKGKDNRHRVNCSVSGKARQKKFRSSDKGKVAAAKGRRVRASDPYKRMHDNIGSTISHMIGAGIESKRVLKFTGMSNAELRSHFRASYDDGMCDSNYGRCEYDSDGNIVLRRWNVGHKIAKALYNNQSVADMQRCWHKDNLFPQWEDENQSLSTKLPSAEVLETLSHVHPLSWSTK